MKFVKVGNKQLAASEPQAEKSAPLTAQDVSQIVEGILSQHNAAPRREIIGFDELVTRLPLGARSLRSEIKKGRVPAIRLPGARRLMFDFEAVCRSLDRFSKGGIEQ